MAKIQESELRSFGQRALDHLKSRVRRVSGDAIVYEDLGGTSLTKVKYTEKLEGDERFRNAELDLHLGNPEPEGEVTPDVTITAREQVTIAKGCVAFMAEHPEIEEADGLVAYVRVRPTLAESFTRTDLGLIQQTLRFEHGKRVRTPEREELELLEDRETATADR
jgi:hypothetical protein